MAQTKLTPDDLANIPQRLGELWIALRRVLVTEIGGAVIKQAPLPFATSAVVLAGTRQISAMDLDESYRTFPPVTRPLQFAEMRRFSVGTDPSQAMQAAGATG